MDPLFSLINSKLEFSVKKRCNRNLTDIVIKKPSSIRHRIKLGRDCHRFRILKRIKDFLEYCTAIKQNRRLGNNAYFDSIIKKNNDLLVFFEKNVTINTNLISMLVRSFSYSLNFTATQCLISSTYHIMSSFIPPPKLSSNIKIRNPCSNCHTDSLQIFGTDNICVSCGHVTENQMAEYTEPHIDFSSNRCSIITNSFFRHLTKSWSSHEKLKATVMERVRLVCKILNITESTEIEDILGLLSMYAVTSQSVKQPSVIAACAYILQRKAQLTIHQIAASLSLKASVLNSKIIRICLATGVKLPDILTTENYISMAVSRVFDHYAQTENSNQLRKTRGSLETPTEEIVYTEEKFFANLSDDAIGLADIVNRISTKKHKKRFQPIPPGLTKSVSALVQKVSTIYGHAQKIDTESMKTIFPTNKTLYPIAVFIYFVGKYMKLSFEVPEVITTLYLNKSTFNYHRNIIQLNLTQFLIRKGLIASTHKKTQFITLIAIIDSNPLQLFTD